MGSENHIGCARLKWAGNGPKDGGGPLGHLSRHGDRGSDCGWTKAIREAAKGVAAGRTKEMRAGQRCWPALYSERANLQVGRILCTAL